MGPITSHRPWKSENPLSYSVEAHFLLFLLPAACLNLALLLFMVVWEPNPEYPVIFFTLLGVWGVGDGIWVSQTNSMYFFFLTNSLIVLTFQLFGLKSQLLCKIIFYCRYCERSFSWQTRGRIRKSASSARFGSHYSVLLFQQPVRHGENVHSSSSMHHRYSSLHRRGTYRKEKDDQKGGGQYALNKIFSISYTIHCTCIL